jgi:hypothetical protein
MNDNLKTEHVKLDPREALRVSPTILLGVSMTAAAALKLVEIESVFDLATSRLFANANQLLSAGLDPKNTYYRFGTPPKDVVNANADGHRVDELRFDSITILDGLGAASGLQPEWALSRLSVVRHLRLGPGRGDVPAARNPAHSAQDAVRCPAKTLACIQPKDGQDPRREYSAITSSPGGPGDRIPWHTNRRAAGPRAHTDAGDPQ